MHWHIEYQEQTLVTYQTFVISSYDYLKRHFNYRAHICVHKS
jgi:hypothetical protein